MSRMLTSLTPHLPDGIDVPDELEEAWLWMEEQGWGLANDNGYFLTPYEGDRELGVVFSAVDDFLEHWFDEVPAGRLALIGTIGGDGSAGALWLDDEGHVRFVGLGSEGEAYLLADSALDFLRLVAIGYLELNTYELGLPPDDDEAVEALAPFRAWVEETFDLEVPTEWPSLGEDEFTDWVAALAGNATAEEVRPEPEDSPGVANLAGDARSLLAVIGTDDGPAALRTVAGLAEVEVPRDATGLRWAGAALRPAGVEVTVRRGVVETIFVRTQARPASYPRPDELVAGIGPSSTIAEVVALLGVPDWQGSSGLRYVVDSRHLHFQFGEAGIDMLTLMRTAP